MLFVVFILLQCATIARCLSLNAKGSIRDHQSRSRTENTDYYHHQSAVEEKRLVAWVHFPKAGTSFGTCLAHYMNESVPADAGIEPLQKDQGFPTVDQRFLMKYPESVWFRDLLWMKEGEPGFKTVVPDVNWGGHTKVTQDVIDKFGGHLFGLFRDPSARMRSSYNHFAPFYEPSEYARKAAGVVTKMLSGQANGLHCTYPQELGGPPCEDVVPDVDLALSRLPSFKFVGLTEEYDFSICLFHLMFGGQCVPAEFVNTQPAQAFHVDAGKGKKDVFAEVEDLADATIHAAVAFTFWERMQIFNVTRRLCAEVCANVPEAFELSEQSLLQYPSDITQFDYDWPGRLKYVE